MISLLIGMNVMAQNTVRLAVYYVTAPTQEIATKLSEVLLNQKLIACCNIVEKIESVQGQSFRRSSTLGPF